MHPAATGARRKERTLWYARLGRMIDIWGRVAAVALAVIVLAHSVGWLFRELTLWQDFRAPTTNG